MTKYYYDEAGNRIRKMTYAYLGSLAATEPPANSDVSNTNNWSIRNDEVYSRDVSGRDLAVYKNNSILEYPFYGLDMIGKIKDDELYFYLKDHLGSIRAVVEDDKIISSQDYDAWGYILEGRTYQSEEGKFKFTGKERDEESFYDYFGARYYDSRIGRWGVVEPHYDNYLFVSPYNYSLNNSLNLIDPDGMDIDVGSVRISDEANKTDNLGLIIKALEELTGLKINVVNDLLEYNSENITGGSSIARDWITSMIDNADILKVYTISERVSHGKGKAINLNPNEINSFIEGAKGGVNKNTMGWGTSFIHEMLHTEFGGNLRDVHGWGETGPVEDVINNIRFQMGENWGQRVSYDYKSRGNVNYYPLSDITKNQLDRNQKPTHFRVEF